MELSDLVPSPARNRQKLPVQVRRRSPISSGIPHHTPLRIACRVINSRRMSVNLLPLRVCHHDQAPSNRVVLCMLEHCMHSVGLLCDVVFVPQVLPDARCCLPELRTDSPRDRSRRGTVARTCADAGSAVTRIRESRVPRAKHVDDSTDGRFNAGHVYPIALPGRFGGLQVLTQANGAPDFDQMPEPVA